MIEWISVNDRLPKRMENIPCSERVLISTVIGVVSAQYDYECDVWVDFFNHTYCPFSQPNYYNELLQVTHWARLPKPPKDEWEGKAHD